MKDIFSPNFKSGKWLQKLPSAKTDKWPVGSGNYSAVSHWRCKCSGYHCDDHQDQKQLEKGRIYLACWLQSVTEKNRGKN